MQGSEFYTLRQRQVAVETLQTEKRHETGMFSWSGRRILELETPIGIAIRNRPMSSLKQQLLDVVAELPEDCTMDEFRYRLYVRQAIEQGVQSIEGGRGYTATEARELDQSWRKSSGKPS